MRKYFDNGLVWSLASLSPWQRHAPEKGRPKGWTFDLFDILWAARNASDGPSLGTPKVHSTAQQPKQQVSSCIWPPRAAATATKPFQNTTSISALCLHPMQMPEMHYGSKLSLHLKINIFLSISEIRAENPGSQPGNKYVILEWLPRGFEEYQLSFKNSKAWWWGMRA